MLLLELWDLERRVGIADFRSVIIEPGREEACALERRLSGEGDDLMT